MPRGENNRKLSREMWAKIVREYQTKLPDGTWQGTTSLAKKYGVAPNAVYYHLCRAGVALRSAKEAHAHGKRCKPIKNLPPFGEEPPLCKCGCGQSVSWNRRRNQWNAYVKGHYRPKRPYHRKAWLEREYVERHRTLDDIARQFDVSRNTIRKALTRVGMKPRTVGESLILSGAVSGPNNPAWKGGIADWAYAPNWKRIARKIRKRDNYTCQQCGKIYPKRSKLLHVHHIDGDKTNNSPDNLVTLCYKCHARQDAHRPD